MKNNMVSQIAFWLSVVTAILAGVVSLGGSVIWLAGTQWMLVAIVFGCWALYFKE